jgi:ribulose-5-phosphate 4-epimerase/fuculose-1-phosphate aldolase
VHDDPANVLPTLTPYSVMRVGRLPLVPYFRPGDRALAQAVRGYARDHRAVLLANHGPVTSGRDLDDAVDSAEELEATARLALQLEGRSARPLTAEQVADVEQAFTN